MRKQQISFSFIENFKREFGGSLLEGKRKEKRPLSTRCPIPLVLKSSHKDLFNPSNNSLQKLIQDQAKKFNIKIYDFAVNWSHIHFLIKLQNEKDYVKFIRSLTSIIAEKIRSVRSGIEQIFTLRPYTRLISWGRDFKNALSYQALNQLESFGFFFL